MGYRDMSRDEQIELMKEKERVVLIIVPLEEAKDAALGISKVLTKDKINPFEKMALEGLRIKLLTNAIQRKNEIV